MKKYHVTLYYHTYVEVEVEALNEDDAITLARLEDGSEQIDDNLMEHGSPEVEEL